MSRRRAMSAAEWAAAALRPAPGSFLAFLVHLPLTDRSATADLAREVVHFATTDGALRQATASPEALRAHFRQHLPGAHPATWPALDELERRWRGAAS